MLQVSCHRCVKTWRHVMLMMFIVGLNAGDTHYVDTTGEVPAWTIESLNPELDKIAFPDNTLDNHKPYIAKPDTVYPSPKWTWEVHTEPNIHLPVAPKIILPTRLKNQKVYGTLNLRPPFSNVKFANGHDGSSGYNLSVEIQLKNQIQKQQQSQQFLGSSPILWSRGRNPRNVGAPKQGNVKRMNFDVNFHQLFGNPNHSRPSREQNPFVPHVLNKQKEIQQQVRLQELLRSNAVREINNYEIISDTSSMTKHEVIGYNTHQSSAGNEIRKARFQRNNFKSLGPSHSNVQSVTQQMKEPKIDSKNKRNVPQQITTQHAGPHHDKLHYTYHDNFPSTIRKDHVLSGVPLGWEGSHDFSVHENHGTSLVSGHRNNENIFLRPIIDIYVDEADYDYITNLADNSKGLFNTGQKHHVEEPPVTYHHEQVFGEHSVAFSPITKGDFTHYDSSTLDLDYNVQYDFGISETQKLKGDAAIVKPGSGFTGHSGQIFGQLGNSNFGVNYGQSNLGEQFHSSGHDNTAGHKFTSGDTIIQFGGHSFGSDYNLGSGHQGNQGFGLKDTIIQSGSHNLGSGDGHFYSGGHHTFDSGDIVYFDEHYNTGDKSAHSGGSSFSSGNKFQHSKGHNIKTRGTFAHLEGSDIGFKNKFTHSEKPTFSTRDKFIDSPGHGSDSLSKFSLMEGHGFGSGDKFTHSGGSSFGSGDEFIHSGKSTLVSGSQLSHAGGSSFDSKDNLFKIGNHDFSPTDAAHRPRGFSFEGKTPLSHPHQSRGFKDVFSMFQPVGHDFGHPNVQIHTEKGTHGTSKPVTSVPNFFDNALSKLISKPKDINMHRGISLSHSKESKPDNLFSKVQDVSKRAVTSQLNDILSLPVETSLGETLPSNFYEAAPVASKEELPSTFFIKQEKLVIPNDHHPPSSNRNVFFDRGSESPELPPAHLLTPSSYDHDSGFHDKELDVHKNNLTVISVPRELNHYAYEHSVQKEESISSVPRGFETYVHLPPNSHPNINDLVRKNEFTKSDGSTPEDYVYLHQAEELDPIETPQAKLNVTSYKYATTLVRSSPEKENEEDNDYSQVDKEDSDTEYKETYLNKTIEELSHQHQGASGVYVHYEPAEEYYF